jgi:hypothetical protein
MKPTRTASVLLLALFAASSPRVALADPPPPAFTIQFDGDAAIWSPFDGFQACETVDTETLCLSLDNVVCNGAGKCYGDAHMEFDGAILNGSGSGPFEAKASCVATPNPDDKVCSASLLIKELVGVVSSCAFELLNFKVRGPVDNSGLFDGNASARLCLEECQGQPRRCASGSGEFDYAVNPPIPWNLTVNPVPDAQNPLKFTGTASDILGFTYTAKGVHNPKNDMSKFVLLGDKVNDPWSAGAKVKLSDLVFQGSDVQDGTANIKVQGNKIPKAPLGP